MKKVKGAALLWCLTVLIVLAIITLTAVSLSVAYYKACMKNAGDAQAELNSQAAAETLRSQLESAFGTKRIYFTYSGNSLLDSYYPERSLSFTEKDREYFKLNEGSDDEKYLTAVRKLESELFADYLKNKNGTRKPVSITFNYGRIDTSVYNHGYYGDTAEMLIDSIKETDADGDGFTDYYTVTVKARSVLSTGHSAAAGAVFHIKPAYFNADRIPAASCALLEVGLSKSPSAEFDNTKGRGVVLGLSGENPCLMLCGDDSNSEMQALGFIKTDADSSTENLLVDEVSYLDKDSFKIVTNNSNVSNYCDYHLAAENTFMDFSEEYILSRCEVEALPGEIPGELPGENPGEIPGENPDEENPEDDPWAEVKKVLCEEHSFDEANITNDSSILDLNVAYELPDAFTKGDNTNNRAKRYIVSGENDGTPASVRSASENVYYVNFSSYVNYLKNNSTPYGDSSFSDKYNKDKDIVCCTVKKNTNGSAFDPSAVAQLKNIVLENGKTYFFRICQNTNISFSSLCSGVNCEVYFQLYDGEGDYPIELTLNDPPEGIKFFAFDGGDTEKSSVRPSSNAANQKNVTIALNGNNDEYTVHGWFSCYKLSVLDKKTSSTELTPKKVYLCGEKPSDFITVANPDELVLGIRNKSYRWVFEKFVSADSGTS